MKRCPTCKRTFEDGLTYCLIDGSVLSAPFEEEEVDGDSRATEVLPESARTSQPTERIASQSTIAAAFQPPPRQSHHELTPAESTPVALIGIIGLVTILCSVAFVILLRANWQDVGSYFWWVLVRRIPIFLVVFIGLLVALVRIKHHVRASLLAILALIIYFMEGMIFYLFNSSMINVMSKMRLSPAVSEWVYFFIYICEDAVFAMVIILLVAAAFKGRNQSSRVITETS